MDVSPWIFIRGQSKITFFTFRKLILTAPIVILIICYSIFLQKANIGLSQQVKVVLNASYPLGEIIPILIVLYTIVSPTHNLTRLAKTLYIFLTIGFFMQFLTDYLFIYSAESNTYVNGGVNDYFYAISYMFMNLVIVAVTNLYIVNPSLMISKKKQLSHTKKKILLAVLPRLEMHIHEKTR